MAGRWRACQTRLNTMQAGLDLKELEGGVAVITGAASGLGYALAIKAAQSGLHVVISDVRDDALEAACRRLDLDVPGHIRTAGFICDVTDRASVKNLLAAVKVNFPRNPIQMIAANAGVLYPRSTVLSGTTEEWTFTYKVPSSPSSLSVCPVLMKSGHSRTR